MSRYFEEPIGETSSLPCGICSKTIGINHRFIKCSICNYKVHIKCNKTDTKTYELMTKNTEPQFCIKCKEDIIPFQRITDQQFFATAEKGINKDIEGLNFSIFPSNRLKDYFKDINNLQSGLNHDDEVDSPVLNCNYTDINSFDYQNKPNHLSLFHLNIASLPKHKDELETILNMIDLNFDIIGITETKLKKNVEPSISTNIEGYKCYSTDTEAEKGGALIYIAEHFNTKPLKSLEQIMYKPKQLESVFIEICNKKKKNIIIGCIYRHPTMDLGEFNEDFFNPLIDKLSSQHKSIYLMGDFNIDLMKIDNDPSSADFFDSLTSNLFVPHIIHPTRITTTTKTLIDNIFSNSSNFSEGISGNLTLSISDHLAQYLLIPEESDKTPKNKIIFKRDTKNFDRENFILDVLSIDWDKVTDINKGDPNESFNRFEATINPLIDKYLPLKKLSRKETKNYFKPWITLGIRNSIKRRDNLHKRYIKAKDNETKNNYHAQYKELRNMIVTLCRESKKAYYQRFFNDNANNIKNTWKGINQIINIKSKKSNQISSLIINNELITDSKQIANNFNEYFCTIAERLQSRIYHASQNFTKYLTNSNDHNFFIAPTNITEIINIIDNLDVNKASGPHSIPIEILHTIKFTIADPLANIINLSFEKGIYFDNMKFSKTIPFFKEKGSNLDCANYRPISLLSNINKIIEKMMHERLYKFLNLHNCIYENQFGFRKKHSTNHALISLTEDIRNSLDNNQISCGFFIDLQKAFDTVNHPILLSKLNHYGI